MKGTMVAGEESQFSNQLEGSCVAKTGQPLSSWLRLWEPAGKAKMYFTPLQADAWCPTLWLALAPFPLFTFDTHKKGLRSH